MPLKNTNPREIGDFFFYKQEIVYFLEFISFG